MSVDNDIPGVTLFGKGAGTFTLPCGYVDPQGIVHNSVHLREMTGMEEDIMDNNNVSVTDRITDILAACCERIGDVSDKKIIKDAIGDSLSEGESLTAADRIAMLLFLRRVSAGDIYKFEQKCPHCEHLNEHKQCDLSTLEIKAVGKPDKRRVKITLPRSGKVAILKVLAAKGEKAISDVSVSTKDVRSLAMLPRLESLDGKMLTKNDLGLIKQLSIVDRNYIRDAYNIIEGSIDTDIEVECNSCKGEFVFPLDLGQVFFSSQGEKATEASLEWV